MKPLSSREIRQGFLDYFKKEDHLIIEGSSVVPKNDPSLLFVNAGMAPLKPYFLGQKQPKCNRMVNVQPCIRTNDIADVGDRHHLTMFEMLGSWSIGDYYKTRAVELAYGLLVDVLGFDVNRLYASVYAGNKDLGLDPDEESYRAWEKMGIPTDRIVMLGEDNFWSAGDTGPCGPCTEVFFDTGDAFGESYTPGKEFDTTKRYIEIWNAGVFMELNRKKDGSYEKLPFKSVDTGSGLERMSMVMNGVDTVYDTDLFTPLMRHVKERYKGLNETDYRIMSDHMRASCFILAAGVIPSNEGQGYIPRRLLRKGIASVYRSGEKLHQLIDLYHEVTEILGEAYPDLVRNKDQILHNIEQEINEFEPVIKSGIKMFNERLKEVQGKQISGAMAFELVSTHGLPLEVISNLAQAQGFTVDQTGYDIEFKKHQNTSRVLSGSKKFSGSEGDKIADRLSKVPMTQFSGYFHSKGQGTILAAFNLAGEGESLKAGEEGYIALDHTIFYAESGGQVGDSGTASNSQGHITIIDTQKQNDIFLHRVKVESGLFGKGDQIQLEIAQDDRMATAANHTATHLLHAALRQHLGNSVTQKGSLVDPSRLRFDFQHNKALTIEQQEEIERTVNSWIWQNLKNETAEMGMDAAVEKGALALFNENYGDVVRVVRFEEASTELCGGCHVSNTAEIGMFTIISESSIAKGVRRIEALTGHKAFKHFQQSRNILKETSELVGVKAEGLTDGIKKLRKQLKESQKSKSSKSVSQDQAFSLSESCEFSGTRCFIALTDLDRAEVTIAAKQIMEQNSCGIVVIGSQNDKNSVYVFVEKEVSKKLSAKNILQATLKPLDGRGGGKPQFAQGGFQHRKEPKELLASLQNSIKEELS